MQIDVQGVVCCAPYRSTPPTLDCSAHDSGLRLMTCSTLRSLFAMMYHSAMIATYYGWSLMEIVKACTIPQGYQMHCEPQWQIGSNKQ